MDTLLNVINFFFELLSSTLGVELFKNAAKIVEQITPIFSLGFSVYIIFVIMTLYKNGVDDVVLNLSKQSVGWIIVIAIALNAGNYAKLATVVYNTPEEVSTWITGTKITANYFNILASSINEKLAAIAAMIEQASISGKIALASAWVTSTICGYLTVFVLLAMYFISKVSLALVLVLGPIFLACLLFPQTRQYGMNWIGQCANYIVTIALYTGIIIVQQKALGLLKLDVKYESGFWSGNYIVPDIGGVMVYNSTLILITIILLPVFWSVPSIASALTGGASVSGHSRMSPVSAVTGLARGVVRGANAADKATGRAVYGIHSRAGTTSHSQK